MRADTEMKQILRSKLGTVLTDFFFYQVTRSFTKMAAQIGKVLFWDTRYVPQWMRFEPYLSGHKEKTC